MKRFRINKLILIHALVWIATLDMICAQTPELSCGEYSLQGSIIARPDKCLGFPTMNFMDLMKNFKTPPNGYGEVPFHWWTGGDTLTKERLFWQLDKFEGTAIQGLNVSYNHTHRLADPVLNEGNDIISFGVPEPSYPAFMSEEWWELWNWFSEECSRRSMGIGLDDYVVGWPGAGFWADRVDEELSRLNYQGRLKMTKKSVSFTGEGIRIRVPESVITVVAYPQSDGEYDIKMGIDLKEPFRLNIKDFVNEGENYVEVLVYSTLANHYYTIPTPERYKSSFTAGLIGPVKILY